MWRERSMARKTLSQSPEVEIATAQSRACSVPANCTPHQHRRGLGQAVLAHKPCHRDRIVRQRQRRRHAAPVAQAGVEQRRQQLRDRGGAGVAEEQHLTSGAQPIGHSRGGHADRLAQAVKFREQAPVLQPIVLELRLQHAGAPALRGVAGGSRTRAFWPGSTGSVTPGGTVSGVYGGEGGTSTPADDAPSSKGDRRADNNTEFLRTNPELA
jgi:hypothetical protein